MSSIMLLKWQGCGSNKTWGSCSLCMCMYTFPLAQTKSHACSLSFSLNAAIGACSSYLSHTLLQLALLLQVTSNNSAMHGFSNQLVTHLSVAFNLYWCSTLDIMLHDQYYHHQVSEWRPSIGYTLNILESEDKQFEQWALTEYMYSYDNNRTLAAGATDSS